MERPDVSVIIPVYQVENYLERAVDSVLGQTLENIEIILVDDGSEDLSGQICDMYAEKYPEKVKVIHKENDGLGMARNTGIEAASGEYIAFLDSDDTAEPQMYEEMYEKAFSGNYDMVMCDVRIIYVDENRETVSETYPNEEIYLPDYIAKGNNITYSVNKLYKRKIWEENKYEKMLFEDIALIPALVTKYTDIGYVKKAFYNYYRRSDTISTTVKGEMADIVTAFKKFFDTSSEKYKDEVFYCGAKQIYWNISGARSVFKCDFISLLKEYKTEFVLNPYIQKDAKIKKLLYFADTQVIPDNIICVSFNSEIREEYREMIKREFPLSNVIYAGESFYGESELPESVKNALSLGKTRYAEEYFALKILYDCGGVVLFPEMRANINLKRLRLNEVFFGFEGRETLNTGCFGAVKGHYIIKALCDLYYKDSVYSKGHFPLSYRLRDFLLINFNLKLNGGNQLLKDTVRVYLPDVLSFDMKDGENCCKRFYENVPEGHEIISAEMLDFWSSRLMENWNLYKTEKNRKKETVRKNEPDNRDKIYTGIRKDELISAVEDTAAAYENSTSWKITKPLRKIKNAFLQIKDRSVKV